jgi:DNA replication protein DnaC
MSIARQVSAIIAESKKSILLLGPQQTGKSTLIASLDPDLSINLAR